MTIHPYVSRMRLRRDPWKGHDTKKGVRSAIRYARQYRRELLIFESSVDDDGWVVYTEIPAAEWDTRFEEGSADG